MQLIPMNLTPMVCTDSLGMKLPEILLDYFGGKQIMNDMMLSNLLHQFFEENWTIDDILEDYYSLKDGVKTDDQWKIHHKMKDVLVLWGTVMTQFLIQNLRLTEDQFALMDMEAGLNTLTGIR